MTDPLHAALAAIDLANDKDPTAEQGRPAARLYGERMSAELARMFPAASDILQIAARGQHIERWTLPRASYPQGKAGYLDWRREQARRHGIRIAEIMAQAGYSPTQTQRATTLLRKEGLKRDDEVQALEDVICIVFIKWYLAAFSIGKSAEHLTDIIAKTARKMSTDGRARAVREFDLPPDVAAIFQG